MEMDGVWGFSNSFAIDADFKRTSGVKKVEALERVLRVANDTDIFFKPCIFNKKLAYR